MRILVGVANHGTKNRHHLDRVLGAYRAMSHEVDFVAFSDAPKDLGPDVEVRVGAPSPNPWSLPFACRTLFAERATDYDVFVYSEDDTLVEQRHLDAFLLADSLTPDDCIPGFMRYELHPTGERSYCTMHTAYHWDPASVVTHGGHVFAEFSNVHSACHLLTQDHLRRALRSGGFLVPPHEGRFDMLASAASDPYTQCGMTRLIDVSHIDDFLLHHLPNVYLGRFGVDDAVWDAQLDALQDIAAADAKPVSMFEPQTRLDTERWDKRFFAAPEPMIVEEVGSGPQAVLSVGTTWGALEAALADNGAQVVAVPVDEVIAAAARVVTSGDRPSGGVRFVAPGLAAALDGLAGRRFDVVVLDDVLPHVADPVGLLRALGAVLAPGGRVVASTPNFRFFRLRHRLGKGPDPRVDDDFAGRGLHLTDAALVRGWHTAAGLAVDVERYAAPEGKAGKVQRLGRGRTDSWLGMTTVTTAHAATMSANP